MACSNCGKELDVSISAGRATEVLKPSRRDMNVKININAPEEEEEAEAPRYCLKCARTKINPAGPSAHLGYITVNKNGVVTKGDI